MARKATEATIRESMWQWGKTPHTKRVLLDAAAQVFADVGFTDASIATVVEKADSSVGSLYHHFGGKSELFLALWELHQGEHEHASAAAVKRARSVGETDPLELFVAGARAYLEGAWARRDLEKLFFDGDTPPTFEAVRRLRTQEWLRQNTVLLGSGADALDSLTAAVISSIIDESAREIALSVTKRRAYSYIDAAETLIRRLDSPTPVAPR